MSNLSMRATRRTSSLNIESKLDKMSGSNKEKVDKTKEAEKIRETDKAKDTEKIKDTSKLKDDNMGPETPKSGKGATKDQNESGIGGEIRKMRDDLKLMLAEMDQRMSVRLKGIDEKFTNMFTEFKNELRQEMGDLKVEMENTKLNMQKMTEKVDDIEKSVQFHSDKVTDLEKKQEEKLNTVTQDLNTKLSDLDTKLKLLEKHDRKYNLLFYGFSEERGENVYDMMRDSFVADLGIDEERVRSIYFSNDHRIPSKSQGPRPVILRFTSYDDKELVLSKAYKYAGSKRRVLVDLPEDMKKERGRLARKAYEIRQKEEMQTRIKDKGLDVYLEVRSRSGDPWVKRVV